MIRYPYNNERDVVELNTNTAAIYTTYTTNNTTQWWITVQEIDATETSRLDVTDGASIATAQAAATADLALDGYQVTQWSGSYAHIKYVDDSNEQDELVRSTRV